MTTLTGAGFDSLCASITTALLSFPERLKPVVAQGNRTQLDIEGDGFDPVLATIIRLAVDGLWLSENFPSDALRRAPQGRCRPASVEMGKQWQM
jgi:hypothetical protein